ncbi:hypothetical protein CerSpe_239400 [Prunus speciosa]
MLKSKIQSLERISSSSSVVFKILKSRNIATTTGSSSSNGVPKEKVDCVVIGAGVVGLAVARELTLKGREVLVLESASTFSTGISSRNSEVIQAGIYYPPNSLKVSSLSISPFTLFL